MALFPAFSTLEGLGDRTKIRILFTRSVKYVFLVLGPILLLIILFAKEILQTWLGNDVALHSKVAMQILALGVLINSLAHIPYALLQGVGRPDITAKFHLVELPFYVGVLWFLVSYFGIAGAATAWTFRVTLDALLLFIATFKVYRLSLRLFISSNLTSLGLAFLGLAIIADGLKELLSPISLLVQVGIFLFLFCMFVWLIWKKVLDTQDKNIIRKVVREYAI